MNNAIEISGLEKIYPKFHLGPLHMNVPRGAIYGFIGANGAGKTTTIDLMLGLGLPDAGTINIFGMHHENHEVDIKRRTGYVGPELRFDAWGRVGRLLRFWSTFYPTWDEDHCTDLLKRFDLKRDEKIATLSTGNRTKLALVTALSHRPELLLLDEPMIGLDAMAKQELFSELLGMVGDESRTVLISSHNLDDIQRITDHVGILAHGKLIVEGETARVVERFAQMRVPTALAPRARGIDGVYAARPLGNEQTLIVDLDTNAPARLAACFEGEPSLAPVTLHELFVGVAREQ